MTFSTATNTDIGMAFARGRLRAAVGLSALAGTFLTGLMSAPRTRAQSQTGPANPPAFEVASIKPSKPGVRGYSIQPLPGRLDVADTP